MENKIIRIGININSCPCNFFINTWTPVSIEFVEFTIFKKEPSIKTNTHISIASPKPFIGANSVCDNVAPTTPVPFTISFPLNVALGKKWVDKANKYIKIKIIVKALNENATLFLGFSLGL